MNIFIILLYLINFALLLINYIHMYQLNYYKADMHMHWCKTNIQKITLRCILALSPLLALTGNLVLQILSAFFLICSIIVLIPKSSKIPLKITGRVLRILAVEIVLSVLALAIKTSETQFIIRLAILCGLIAPLLCLVANFILLPAEWFGRKHYIDGAKKILAEQSNLTIIGVTGSYGKTSMKNFLGELLSEKYDVLVTPKNYNTQLGIARTIREYLKPTHDIFICEMGAMWEGEIAECCDIAQPSIGIITAIGPQHLQTFGDIDTIVRTKFELAQAIEKNDGKLFLNYDNDYIRKKNCSIEHSSYGLKKDYDYYADELKSGQDGQSFVFHDGKKSFEAQTKLLGEHNIENLVGAIAVAKELGVSDKDIKFAIRRIKSVPHRLELTTKGDLSIIDDSYNSNPVSSCLAVDTLAKFDGIKIVVTPGLIELGDDEERYNEELGTHIAKKKCDFVYLVGDNAQTDAIEAGLIHAKFKDSKIQRVKSPQEAVSYATKKYPSEKLTVLLLNDLPDNY